MIDVALESGGVRTLPELKNLPPAKPYGKAGGGWKEVNHGFLVESLIERFKTFKPVETRLFTSWNELNLSACILFAPKRAISPMLPALGIEASNSRKRGLAFYAGLIHEDRVMGNQTPLVIARTGGEDQATRLHWKYSAAFDMKQVGDDVFDWWRGQLQPGYHLKQSLMETPATLKQGADAIIYAAKEAKLIPWSKAGRILARWEHGTPYKSAWTLLETFWFLVAQTFPARQMPVMMEVKNLILTLFSNAPAKRGQTA